MGRKESGQLEADCRNRAITKSSTWMQVLGSAVFMSHIYILLIYLTTLSKESYTTEKGYNLRYAL